MKRPPHRAFGIVATIVVVAAVAWGFVVIGSPESRRVEKLDQRRLADLQGIVAEMQELVLDRVGDEPKLKRPLFPDLESLQESARRRRISLRDPETGAPYEYRVLGPTRYEICASFSLAREADHDVFWNHPAGRHCWVIDALDPP